MSKDHKFDFAMHRVVYGEPGDMDWMGKLSEKEKAEIRSNRQKNVFDQILHFLYTNGMTMEDMASVLAHKASRHCGENERQLGARIKKVLTSI